MAGENSSVKITIDVIDANSGQVVSTVAKNLSALGDAGSRAGTRIVDGSQKATVSLKTVGDAGAATGKALGEAFAPVSASLDAIVPSAARAQQAYDQFTKRAGDDLRALDAQHAALTERLKKPVPAFTQTNTWQGPMRQSGAKLADSFGDIGTVRGEMDNLGESFVRLPQKMDEAERSARKFGTSTAGHTTTALDRVRLLSQEFGLRLPRALETMIARTPAVMNVIGALGSAVAGLAIAEVFVRAGTALYDLEQRFLSINAPAQAFYETMEKASKLDYSNTRTLATTQMRLGLSEQGSAALPKFAKASQTQGFLDIAGGLAGGPSGVGMIGTGIAGLLVGHSSAQGGAEAGENMMKLTAQNVEQTHKQALAEIEVNHALDGNLSRRAQIAAETAKQKQIQAENVGYGRKLDMALGNPAPKDAGQKEADTALEQAQREAALKTIQLNQEVSAAVMKARNSATEAGLQGERLFAQKQQDAVAELRAELAASHMLEEFEGRRDALNRQYENERIARLRDLTAETKRMAAEAASAGLTGVARMESERTVALGNVDAAQAKFSGGAPISAEAQSDFGQQRATANKKVNTQIEEAQKQFNDHIHDLDEARSDSTMSASERIEAANARAKQEITKAWTDLYGQLGAMDSRRVQSYQALQGELGRMDAEAQREKLQNRRQIEDETDKLEAEAGRRGLTREQEQAQAILDEYNARYRTLEELRVKDAGNADLYRRQEIAAEQIKNGKLVEEERQTRDKIAGVLRGFMSNPLQELKRQGEEAASKYGADLLLKVSGRTKGPGAAPLGGELPSFGLPGGIFHGGAGRGRTEAGVTDPGHHEREARPQPTVATTSSVSSASTTLSAATATIYVTSATFASMGAGGNTGASLPAAALAASSTGSASSTRTASPRGIGSLYLPSSTASVGDLGATGSGSTTDSVAGTSMSSAGTFSPAGLTPGTTGGPAVAAARASMGIEDAGPAPMLSQAMGMGNQANELSKALGTGDLGAKAESGISKVTGLSTDTLGKVGGVAGGAMGLFSAVESNGGLGGGLQGALSGAKLGAMFGGPVGAAIGAVAGGIVGFLGFGGASKAKQYDTEQVKPRIAADLLQFGNGSMDYSSAYDDLVKLDEEARKQIKQWGPGGKREWDDAIHPEIMKAQQTLTREQKAGRSQYGATAAQFHNGGIIGDFGSMGTNNGQGWVHAQQGEFVVQQQAVPSHYQALQLMQSGASHGDMANYYGGGAAGGTTSPAASPSNVNLNFHSHDASGAYDLFMENRHVIRDALNQSYLENSGGADA